jgi:hypothetical protein
MMPMEVKNPDDGSGTDEIVGNEAVKLPDCELVMLLPEVKSAAEHALPFVTQSGQKYSWIFWGVGGIPFGSEAKELAKPAV